MWIVVLEGQTHVGPFEDSDAAFDWIEKNDGDGMTAEPLISPDDEN